VGGINAEKQKRKQSARPIDRISRILVIGDSRKPLPGSFGAQSRPKAVAAGKCIRRILKQS
jgi:hypothetical protein